MIIAHVSALVYIFPKHDSILFAKDPISLNQQQHDLTSTIIITKQVNRSTIYCVLCLLFHFSGALMCADFTKNECTSSRDNVTIFMSSLTRVALP